MNRADRAAKRRQEWHEQQIESAATSKQGLWAACGWLVSEAWRAGSHEIDAAKELILTRVHEIREGTDDDRHGYGTRNSPPPQRGSSEAGQPGCVDARAREDSGHRR